MTTVVGHETEPREPTLTAPSDWEAVFTEFGIKDPVLLEHAHTMISRFVEVDEQVRELGNVLAASDQAEFRPIDQSIIDEAVIDAVGEDTARSTRQMASLFAELNKPAPVHKDEERRFRMTHLADAYSHYVWGDRDISRQARRNVLKSLPKADKITDYWREHSQPESSLLLDASKRAAVREVLCQPVEDLFSDKDIGELTELRELGRACEAVNPHISLEQLQFLVATDIVRLMGHPLINAAMSRTRFSANREVQASGHAQFFWSAEIFALVADEKPNDALSLVTGIYNKHMSRRFGLPIPSRKFNQAYKELKDLTFLYIDLHDTRRLLDEVPAFQSAVTENAKTLEDGQVNRIAGNLETASVDSFNDMVHRVNDMRRESTVEQRTEIHDEALGFDQLRVAFGKQILDRLQSLGVRMSFQYQEALNKTLRPNIQRQLEELATNFQLDELRVELDDRLEQVRSIDARYNLTNNQLRQRTPDAIRLAKVLSESIHDHDPLPIEASRAVVALMLGAYEENGNDRSDYPHIIERYLADAEQLRQLTLELGFLGQRTSSKLVETLNLLDELIDSGTFDRIDSESPLGQFEEFLLEYMLATTEPTSPEITETELAPEPEPEEKDGEPEPEPLPALPVETLRQADLEDLLVFPPGSKPEDVIEDYVRVVGETELPNVEWERIRQMIVLRDHLVSQSVDVQFMRTRHASWQVLPFFVLEARLPGMESSVAIVESPVYGNATYIYREARDRLDWRDVVQLSKQEARDLGAVPMVHVDGTRLDNHFRKVYDRLISELTIRQ